MAALEVASNFNPFLYLTTKINVCQGRNEKSGIDEDFLQDLNLIEYEKQDLTPKYSFAHITDRTLRGFELISCRDCVDYVENCVDSSIVAGFKCTGLRWDFCMYREDMESRRSLIRFRFRMTIERVIKRLSPGKNRQRQFGVAKHHTEPFNSFLQLSVSDHLESVRKALKTCQTRQKVVAMFRSAVLKVVWDFHMKNNQPWRYLMFYWKIVVNQELPTPYKVSVSTVLQSSIQQQQQMEEEEELMQPVAVNSEPFQYLTLVAKKYVDEVAAKSGIIEQSDNVDGNQFRIPVCISDDNQERFYAFYENFLIDKQLNPTAVEDPFEQFEQRTAHAVKVYTKLHAIDTDIGQTSYNTSKPIDECQETATLDRSHQQALMKKRLQLMHVHPINEADKLISDTSTVQSKKKRSSINLNNRTSLLPPPSVSLPKEQMFEHRKESLPRPSRTFLMSPRNKKMSYNNNTTKEIVKASAGPIELFVPHRTANFSVYARRSTISPRLFTESQRTVSGRQLQEIVDRLRRPLDRTVKSKVLRQLMRKEKANLAKKRTKPEREVLQIVQRLSTTYEKSPFDDSAHLNFEQNLRKYESTVKTIFRPKGDVAAKYAPTMDDEPGRLLKGRKSISNERLSRSSRSINDDTEFITVEAVRTRSQSSRKNSNKDNRLH